MPVTLHFLNAKLFLSLLATLFQHHFAFATSNPTGLSLKAFIDDSPGSPLYGIQNLTSAERMEKLFHITNARVNYLHSILRPNGTMVSPDNIHIPIIRDRLFYAAWFNIGSQRHPVKLLLDTGGGLTWTQCQPCRNCFPQNPPIYDHRVSSTYGTMPCDHPFCDEHSPQRLYSCVNGVCVYNIQYGGGTITKGIASFESFQLYIDVYHTRIFSNVIFGCSDETIGVSFGNGDISGIFGLSLSPVSIANQLAPIIHNRFSYCMIPFLYAMPHPMILRFGEDIPHLPPGGQTTLFVRNQANYFFYLELLDISIAGHRLGFLPGTFAIRQGGKGGCFIDSGALFTLIDTDAVRINAYQVVIATFDAYYRSKGLQRTRSFLGFELCYETPLHFRDFAAITFHFNGADYTVDGNYGHYFDYVNHYFCVAIGKNSIGTVLGAWHQQNKRIIYDGGIGGLQFADEQCVNDVL